MAATTCASEGTAGRKVILLASAMVRHATQRRLGEKADGRSLVQPATWPALAELAGEQPSARRHPAGSMLFYPTLNGSSSLRCRIGTRFVGTLQEILRGFAEP